MSDIQLDANGRLRHLITLAGLPAPLVLEILDTAAQKHVIQRKDIASMEGSAQSIMPAGFDALPADDLKSLLEYLASSVHK